MWFIKQNWNYTKTDILFPDGPWKIEEKCLHTVSHMQNYKSKIKRGTIMKWA